MPQTLKLTNKLTGKEFEKLSGEYMEDMTVAIALFIFHINSLIVKSVEDEWSVDTLLDQIELMETGPDESQIKIDLIAKDSLYKVYKTFRLRNVLNPEKRKKYLSRMKKKYEWTGGGVQDLFERITEKTSENIMGKVDDIVSFDAKKKIDRLSTKQKRLTFPEKSDYYPSKAKIKAIAVKKSENISRRMKQEIQKNLRKAIEESGMTYSRGELASRVNRRTIANMEKRLQATFDGYTRIDPKLKSPAKIHSLAVTEIRTTVDSMKQDMAQSIIDKNPDALESSKRWIHNAHLSKNKDDIRIEHRDEWIKTKNNPIPFNEYFMIGGSVPMLHPHDINAGPDQNVNCHCDWEVLINKKVDTINR